MPENTKTKRLNSLDALWGADQKLEYSYRNIFSYCFIVAIATLLV